MYSPDINKREAIRHLPNSPLSKREIKNKFPLSPFCFLLSAFSFLLSRDYIWIAQPKASSAASITASCIDGCAWIVRAMR